MVETVAGVPGEKPGQQLGGRRIEGLVVAAGPARFTGQPFLEFGEGEGDGRADLFREVEVLPGRVGEQGVDEVEAPDVAARASGGAHLRTRACARGC